MAPAIAHFLVGASLLLLLVTPIALRYEINRENALWLVPLGGIWGLLPDIHHIAPVFAAELYVLHNTPWMDLFALHYTLDRPAIRARYSASVFGSIALFVLSIGAFWESGRVRTNDGTAGWTRHRLVVGFVATAGGAAYATVAMGVLVSIQEGFREVGALVGGGVLAGGLVLIGVGGVLGVVYAAGLEVFAIYLPEWGVRETVGLGCLFGIVSWIGGVVLALPVWAQVSTGVSLAVPFVHFGSLVTLVIFGAVFGGTYTLIRGTSELE